MTARREPAWLLGAVGLIGVLLAIEPLADRFTWLLENVPVIIGMPILMFTYRRFPLTPMLYRLLAVHALVLMVGGHWTYAAVPAGDWVREYLHLERNPYDRLGHLAQGFIPVILVRELLLRHDVLRRGAWSVAVLLFVVLGISAAYELIEWQTAVWSGSAADDFLGAQGDVWDSQWDMACALMGAAMSLVLLSRCHDRQLAALPGSAGV